MTTTPTRRAASPFLLRWALSCALTLLLAGFAVASSRDPSEPRKVKVSLANGLTPQALMTAGLDVIEAHPGRFAMVLEWPGDAARIASLRAPSEVVDEDPGVTEAGRARQDLAGRSRPRGKTVLSAEQARQGKELGVMRYVLNISLALAVIAGVVVYAIFSY